MKNILGAFFAALLLVSCGDDGSGSYLKLNGVEYAFVQSGSLQTSESSISGTGSIIFREPLPGLGAKSSFRLTMALPDTGAIILYVNSKNDLSSGAVIQIERAGPTVKAGAPTAMSDLSGVDATNSFTLQIDYHNDEGHLLIWSGAETNFVPGTALLDTDDTVPKGTGGAVWGILLSNATLTAAAASPAKYTE